MDVFESEFQELQETRLGLFTLPEEYGQKESFKGKWAKPWKESL